MRRLLLLVALLLSPVLTHAATYYTAASGGSDARSCATAQNIATPKQTINSGLACLSGTGDTLFIRTGTYNENISAGTYPGGTSWNNPVPGGSVVWVGAYQTSGTFESVILQGGGEILNMAQVNYVVWDHLHLRGTSMNMDGIIHSNAVTQRFQYGEIEQEGLPPCPAAILPFGQQGGISIIVDDRLGTVGEGAQFIGNNLHHSPCAYSFYVQEKVTALLIEGNIMHDNAGPAIQLYTICHYANPPCFKNAIIRNNIMYNNSKGFNPQTGNRYNNVVMTLSECDNCQIYNNIMYNNFAGIEIGRSSINSAFWNNTFYNNPADGVYATFQIGVAGSASGIVVRNNLSYLSGPSLIQGSSANYTASNNLFGVDPSFVSPGGANFRLQAGSPAINQGTCVGAPTPDVEGTPRPQGGACDIGAFEFGGVALPVPTNLRMISTTIQ